MSIRDTLGFSPQEINTAKQDLINSVEVLHLPEESQHISEQVEEPTVQEIAAPTTDIIESARTSLDFLAAMAMPTIFKYCFPPVFLGVWAWLLEYIFKPRDFSQLALGLPRGFAKSTVMKLFILFCILFTKKKFILVVAANSTLAENILSDVIDMLEEPNIRAVFGDWKLGIEKDTLGLKKFGFRGRNIILAAIGSETSVRGLNLKNERPDLIVFDDVQTRENADSMVQAESLERWIVGTVMKTKSPFGCLFLYVGNMYPTKYCILRKFKENPRWVKFIAGGILADGTSLWEELVPIQQLLNEYENDLAMGHPEIFFSEVLNDENASENNLVDFSKLKPYPAKEDDIPAGNFIVIDPSNNKIGGDNVSIGYFEIHETKPCMRELIDERISPGETIRRALALALRRNCRLIAIESNAYQYSLLYWFDYFCNQLGITGIHCVDVYSGSQSKAARILQMFKTYVAGELYVHPDCRAAVHLQIMQYRPLKRDNTDGILDLLTYAPRVVDLYSEYIVSLNIINEQEFSATKVLEHNSPF